MPRTRHYIFNTLTVVSLLLMLATVGLWVRTRADALTYEGFDDWTIASLGGKISAYGWPDDGSSQSHSDVETGLDPDDDAASALEDMDY